MNFDPRITPARPDLAAAHLRGKVEAGQFVEGTVQEVIVGIASVRSGASHGATQLTEALRGERVTIYESDDEGWAWGQLAADGYVGWLPSAALLAPAAAPTHRVAALRTFVFPGPSIKLPPMDALPLGAQVAVAREENRFAVLASGGYLPKGHLAALGTHETDFVAVAERFLGTPYLWGGVSGFGIDCSGLVQLSMRMAGKDVLRDSDMQAASIGTPFEPGPDFSGFRRGDLVFWKGHVAIMTDAKDMIHANGHTMLVSREGLKEAVDRIGYLYGGPTGFRRP